MDREKIFDADADRKNMHKEWIDINTDDAQFADSGIAVSEATVQAIINQIDKSVSNTPEFDSDEQARILKDPIDYPNRKVTIEDFSDTEVLGRAMVIIATYKDKIRQSESLRSHPFTPNNVSDFTVTSKTPVPVQGLSSTTTANGGIHYSLH